MKALVFGGSGFLGSHVADALSDSGYAVTVFDRVKSPYLRPDQAMVVGDILDEVLVKRVIVGADVVYNFAGIADIDQAAAQPVEVVKRNILGNTLILEACRIAVVKRFVFASSLYVYGKSGSFYRSTKLACELLIENYNEIYGLPYTILRYGSLYGPRAGDTNAISRFIKQALEEGKIIRHGDGEELREYVHVLDAAKGSVAVLSDEFKNQNVILTGQQQIRIRDLLTMINEILGNRVKIKYIPATESYHYEITPYAFTPRVGKRLVQNTYLDLGQGVLDIIHAMARQLELDTDFSEAKIKEKKKR
jgi:UDP-glucose 4-epimerase